MIKKYKPAIISFGLIAIVSLISYQLALVAAVPSDGLSDANSQPQTRQRELISTGSGESVVFTTADGMLEFRLPGDTSIQRPTAQASELADFGELVENWIFIPSDLPAQDFELVVLNVSNQEILEIMACQEVLFRCTPVEFNQVLVNQVSIDPTSTQELYVFLDQSRAYIFYAEMDDNFLVNQVLPSLQTLN